MSLVGPEVIVKFLHFFESFYLTRCKRSRVHKTSSGSLVFIECIETLDDRNHRIIFVTAFHRVFTWNGSRAMFT